MKIHYYTVSDTVTTLEREKVVDFLFQHLDQFGDTKTAIRNAIDYAFVPYKQDLGSSHIINLSFSL